jgi:Holliday junction resolvase RusA-like endonuclease
MTTFIIPGPPIPKGRPRKGPNGWYTPARTAMYEQRVAQEAMVAGIRLEPGKRYTVEILLHVSRWRGDVDNCAKSILDGLAERGKAFGWDDRQVCDLVVREIGVLNATEERTVVTITERGPA